jgi:hypothetical protein
MPPLPFSSLVVVGVVGVVVVVVVDVVVPVVVGVVAVVVEPVVVVVPVAPVVVDPVVVVVGSVVTEDGVETVELLLSSLLAITTTATIKPTMTAIKPAISRRVFPCGWPPSGPCPPLRMIRVGSSFIGL